MNNFTRYLNLFFNDYLTLQLNCSNNTIVSYKDTFRLLLKYLMNEKEIKIKDIDFKVLNKNNIKVFLNYIEDQKKCSVNTRNQRLAAIKSFFQFVGIENIEYLNEVQDILNIRMKKTIKKENSYLTTNELEEMYNNMPKETKKERRNYVLLVLLYDSAARLSEILNVKVGDLKLDAEPSITLLGKGRKERCVPIMNKTKDLLGMYIEENKLASSSYLFSNSKKEKINSRTIQLMISKYNTTNKKITPHSFRRSRAIHLLEAGVDIIYIRDLLNHSSITTTERYAKASVEYKRKMIEKTYSNAFKSGEETSWNQDKELLEELINL